MKSLNFEILRSHASDLADAGGFAERYAYDDPGSTVVKLRIVAEQLVLHIFDCLSLQLPPRPKLFELLDDPAFQRVAPRAIRYKIDAVRIHGNHGAHGRPVSVETALCMLRETYRIVCWFFLVYVREARADCPRYTEPATPSDIDSKTEPSEARAPASHRISSPQERSSRYLESPDFESIETDTESRSDATESYSRGPAEDQGSSAADGAEETRIRFSLGVAPEADRDMPEEPSQRVEAFDAFPEAEEDPSVDLAAMTKRKSLRRKLGKQGMLTAGIRGAFAARKATQV